MAKAKKEEEVKMSFKEKVAELEKKFKKPEDNGIFIPSGSIGFDWALGGGYKTGRIYEFIAWEGAGKSTMALHAIAECQNMGENAAYIDAEHALNKKYAKQIGVDWDNLAIFQPSNGEEGFEWAKSLIKTGELRLLVIDSTSGMLPKKQMEDPEGTSNLGLHARLMGQAIPKIVDLASTYKCAVIIISQFREKIGIMFGSPETTQGGNALKFWASCRTEFRKELTKEGDDVLGIVSKFKVIKNKETSPYRTGRIPIKFGEGIQKLEELMILGNEYEIINKHGNNVKILKNEQKYSLEEFYKLLQDNEDFRKEIITDITNKMNNDTTRIELDKTETA